MFNGCLSWTLSRLEGHGRTHHVRCGWLSSLSCSHPLLPRCSHRLSRKARRHANTWQLLGFSQGCRQRHQMHHHRQSVLITYRSTRLLDRMAPLLPRQTDNGWDRGRPNGVHRTLSQHTEACAPSQTCANQRHSTRACMSMTAQPTFRVQPSANSA